MGKSFDIIGDIHGMLLSFRSALGELGYTQRSSTWFHPEGRILVSVGDLIDRGPDPLGCLGLMKKIIGDGCGYMVLGNHEIDALQYTTRHSRTKEWLREHSEGKKFQFSKTQRQIDSDPARWEILKAFLKKQPTYLELDDGKLRVVHACWGYKFLDVRDLPVHVDSQEILERTADKEGRDPMWRAVECCIKGPEQDAGVPFKDKDGIQRDSERVPWWETYPAKAPFVTFGHYWFGPKGSAKDRFAIKEPALLGPGKNTTCLDFSLGNGGSVVVLRWPEKELQEYQYCEDAALALR